MNSIPFGLGSNDSSLDVEASAKMVIENSVECSVYEPMEAKALTRGMHNKLMKPSQNESLRVLQHIHNARSKGNPMKRGPCEEYRASDVEMRDDACLQPPEATQESKYPAHNNSISFMTHLNINHDDHQRTSKSDYKDELWYSRRELQSFRRDRDHSMSVLMAAVRVKQHNVRYQLSRIWLRACKGSRSNSSVQKMATLMSDPLKNCVGTEK